MSVDWNKVDDTALALMHLTTSIDRSGTARAWKGHDWDVLNRMFERGWVSDPQTKARSVVVAEAAVRRSRELFERLFGTTDEPQHKPTRIAEASGGQDAPRCECGCGTAVRGSDFVPGHDQKLRIQLEKRVGGLLALRDLIDSLEQHANDRSTVEELSQAVRNALRE